MATKRPLAFARAVRLRDEAIQLRDHDALSARLITFAENTRLLLSWYLQPLVEIPAGAELKTCFGCGAPVYFGRSSNGRPTPVSMKDPRAFAPTSSECGQGINHFIDCPKGSDYRVRRDRDASPGAASTSTPEASL